MSKDASAKSMTPKAAAAFAVYAGLGPSRSLARAAGECSANVRQLERWSSEYDWPGRIAGVEQSEAEQALRRIARKKLAIYERTIDEYERRTAGPMIAAMPLGDIHPVHDRTKPAEIAAAEQAPTTIMLNILEREDGPR